MRIGRVLGRTLDSDTRIVGYLRDGRGDMVLQLYSISTKKRDTISREETLEILKFLGEEE